MGGESSLDYTTFKLKGATEYATLNNGKSRSLDITPTVGYFIVNNLAVGLEAPYSFSKDTEGDISNTMSSFFVVPFVRYYFDKAKMKPYLHGGVGPGWGNNKTVMPYTPNVKIPTNLLAYEMGGGIDIFINEHVALDIGMGYTSLSTKYLDPNINMKWKNTMSGISASIGIVVCL